jgi:hypothetical protein
MAERRPHGGISFSMKGEATLRKALLALALDNRSDEAGKAIEEEMQIELAASQEIVPVASGALQRSGRVIPTVVSVSGNEVQFVSRIIYGNAEVQYAVAQHEKLTYEHDDGEAKYLESVMRQSAPFMAQRIARRLIALFARRAT